MRATVNTGWINHRAAGRFDWRNAGLGDEIRERR